ncbi:MAG: hypothetical protein AAGI50_12245 [Pseudomonadota bacterium]
MSDLFATNTLALQADSLSVADQRLFFTSGQTIDTAEFLIDPNIISQFTFTGSASFSDSVIAPPAVQQTNVFSSISVIDSYVLNAISGIDSLRGILRNQNPAEEDPEGALYAALENYIATYLTGDINETFPGRAAQITRYFPADANPATLSFTRPEFTTTDTNLEELSRSIEDGEASATDLHPRLFDMGRVMLEDSRTAQRLRSGLVRIRKDRIAELERRRRELATVEQEIVTARRELDALQSARLQSLSDAQSVQRLASENWAATEDAYAERRAVLENNDGLYYVRVRETPLSLPPPDPLPLRPDRAGDLVPGCSGRRDQRVPEELEPFLEALLEVPIEAWTALRGRAAELPERRRIDRLVHDRRARFTGRRSAPSPSLQSAGAIRIAPLGLQMQATIADLSVFTLAAPASLIAYQAEAAEVLSLADLLSGPAGRLRSDAETLRAQLEQALVCALERLDALPSSLRLLWAEAAEVDRLAIDDPALWPGIDRVDDARFNDVRTLFELVAWWFARLHPGASSVAETAMRATLRAALMLAGGEDPQDLLHGAVAAPPGRLKPGKQVRLTLNRAAVPGALLQLLDPSSAVVGQLRLEDEDGEGARAVVVSADENVLPDTRYSVIGRRIGPG